MERVCEKCGEDMTRKLNEHLIAAAQATPNGKSAIPTFYCDCGQPHHCYGVVRDGFAYLSYTEKANG